MNHWKKDCIIFKIAFWSWIYLLGTLYLLRCIPEFFADMPWHVDIKACLFDTLFSYLRQPYQHILCFAEKKDSHNNLLNISLLNFAVHIISNKKN